jgi:hypothetical protein
MPDLLAGSYILVPMNPDYLWLTGAMQLLTFFVVGPAIAIAIACAAWRGESHNFNPKQYGTACIASGVTASLLFAFAKWMNVGIRTAQYFLQLTCVLLSGLLFGVCMGCFFPIVLHVWRWHKTTRLADRQGLEVAAATTAMDKKLRLNREGCSLVGPDGQVIRQLLPSEMAGIILEDTFRPGYADDHVEEMIYDEQKAAQHLAWMRDQGKEEEHFIAWWKSATYEQRLVVVKRWYGILLPHIRAECARAEDVASIADISSDRHLVGVLTQSEARSRGAVQEEKKK